MRRRMKQLMGILLSLALMLGLIPGMNLTVYADGQKAYGAYDVTTAENRNKTDDALKALQVKFNGKSWYIIADGSTAVNAGTVTLLAAENLETSVFHDSSNAYSTSTIKTTLENMTASGGSFADVKNAINTVKVKGSDSDTEVDAKLYLLSYAEASVVPVNVRKFSTHWWLRTPGGDDFHDVRAEYVLGFGGPVGGYINTTGDPVSYLHGVRPALQLNLSKVTFDSSSNTFSLPAVGTYTVIASDDGNGSASADPESGETGTKVTIKATPNNGCSFKEWEVISGGITLADKNSAETTFNIGSANVEVKAHFEKKSQPEPSPEPEPKPKRESKSEKKSEEHSSKPAVINPDTVEGYFLVNGQILPGVAMGKTKQGPAAQIVLNANRPTGWLEAFTFNMAISGKVDYTLKNGVLTIIIPLEYQKAGRTFAIMALDKNGKAWTFADIDKNPSTVTANINVEGYAFALIYKD